MECFSVFLSLVSRALILPLSKDETHPSPPKHPRPEVAALLDTQGGRDNVCRASLQALLRGTRSTVIGVVGVRVWHRCSSSKHDCRQSAAVPAQRLQKSPRRRARWVVLFQDEVEASIFRPRRQELDRLCCRGDGARLFFILSFFVNFFR